MSAAVAGSPAIGPAGVISVCQLLQQVLVLDKLCHRMVAAAPLITFEQPPGRRCRCQQHEYRNHHHQGPNELAHCNGHLCSVRSLLYNLCQLREAN